MAKEDTQFKSGQSGNPNGRPPKEHSITGTIRAMMDESPEIKRELGSKILDMAKKGDLTAIKTIWNYLDGMPTQQIDQKTEGTLEINIVEEKESKTDE